MAGAKPRKGRKDDKDDKDDKAKASRESRLQGEMQPQAEWFGSAVRADLWLIHLDVRAAGNGLLVTVSPAEVGYPAMARQLRLRNDDGGQGLRDLAAAFRTGTQHALGGGTDRWLAFFPDPQQPGFGTLVSARPGPDPEGPADILRRADRPLTLWADAGTAMDGIIESLDTTLPPEQWDPERPGLPRLPAARLRQHAVHRHVPRCGDADRWAVPVLRQRADAAHRPGGEPGDPRAAARRPRGDGGRVAGRPRPRHHRHGGAGAEVLPGALSVPKIRAGSWCCAPGHRRFYARVLSVGLCAPRRGEGTHLSRRGAP
ncbi:hypothetical protein [Kitasatospora paranensis]|uniref:hypothetical protein n=1 Tax=Kitasatospora paranensis TaxID=258053 RepID=UPI003613E24A